MDELWVAAKVCRVANVMRPYLELEGLREDKDPRSVVKEPARYFTARRAVLKGLPALSKRAATFR
jgi:hypothetical protein